MIVLKRVLRTNQSEVYEIYTGLYNDIYLCAATSLFFFLPTYEYDSLVHIIWLRAALRECVKQNS